MRKFLLSGFNLASSQLGNAIKPALKKAALKLEDAALPAGMLFQTPNGLIRLTRHELLFGVHRGKERLGFKYFTPIHIHSFCQTDSCQIWLKTDEDWAVDFLTRAVKSLGWEIKEI